MLNYEKLINVILTPADGSELATIRIEPHGEGTVIVNLSELAAENIEFVSKVMSAFGFIPSASYNELAGMGVYQFTNNKDDIANHEKNLYLELDLQPEPEEAAFYEMDNHKGGGDLKIVGQPDTYRMAQRMFQSMQGGEENYTSYARYLMGLDDFLPEHAPDPTVFNQKKNDATLESDIKDVDPPAQEQSVAEVASKFFPNFKTRKAFLKTFSSFIKPEIELAKKEKSARSKFLKALMAAMSTDAGNALAEAYASGDGEKFAEAFETIGMRIMDTMEPPEDEGEGEEVETEGSDDGGTDGSESDTVDSGASDGISDL